MLRPLSRYQRLADKAEHLRTRIWEEGQPSTSSFAQMYADVREQMKVEGRLAERYAEAYTAQCHTESATRYQVPEPVKIQEQHVTTQCR